MQNAEWLCNCRTNASNTVSGVFSEGHHAMPPSTQEKNFRINFHVFLAMILAISRLTSTPKPDSNYTAV